MSSIPERCVNGAPALSPGEVVEMARVTHDDWDVDGTTLIRRRLAVDDFASALRVVNQVGVLAELHGHHPDLAITDYRNVTITLTTHDAGGLSANDFVLARQIDALLAED